MCAQAHGPAQQPADAPQPLVRFGAQCMSVGTDIPAAQLPHGLLDTVQCYRAGVGAPDPLQQLGGLPGIGITLGRTVQVGGGDELTACAERHVEDTGMVVRGKSQTILHPRHLRHGDVNQPGAHPDIRHFTASAVVLDDEDRVLLVHHKKVGRWLYPGGHIDPNEDPVQAALREVHEETGIRAVAIGKPAFTHPAVRSHTIPWAIIEMDVTDSKVGAHRHVDLVYVARATGGDLAAA